MRRAVFCAVLLWLTACAAQTTEQYRPVSAEGIPSPLLPLTEAEQQAAASAALTELTRRELRGSGPLYFVHAEAFRDKADERGTRRLALVTHYRYEGDLAIVSVVDLTGGQVLEVRSTPHIPVPLAREEFEAAREIAFADPRVAEALGAERERVVVEPLLLHSSSPNDPLFGRRVVRLLFRAGRDYLSTPVVHVDLTSRQVIVGVLPGARR